MLGVGLLSRRVGALRLAATTLRPSMTLARPSLAALRSAPLGACLRRGLATAAAEKAPAAASKAKAAAKQPEEAAAPAANARFVPEDWPAVRDATAPAVGERPSILDKPAKSLSEHRKGLSALNKYHAANQQTVPFAPHEKPEYETVPVKPRNKRESKLFAHIRRIRLTRSRELFPAPPRPYFPPIRVNHTPKSVHVQEAADKARAAATKPVSARLAAFINATASAASEGAPIANGQEQLQLAAPAAAAAEEEQAEAPATHFAIIDINSKQHKVVEGDLLMVDRLGEVSVGDKLEFDRVLMVAAKHYTVIGRPFIPYAKVSMTCEEHAYTRHMIIFKKHRRKGYRKTQGYRHKVTLLRVDRVAYDADADATVEVLTADKLPAAKGALPAGVADLAAAPSPVPGAVAVDATATTPVPAIGLAGRPRRVKASSAAAGGKPRAAKQQTAASSA